MPVLLRDEWAIVKKPDRHQPWIWKWGRVQVGVPTVSDQDPPQWPTLVVTVDEQLYAMNVSEMLNREIAHDGHWMVSWTSPAPHIKRPMELVIRWLDSDKDIQFRLWIEGPFPKINDMPLSDIVGSAEKAWIAWNEVDKHWLAVRPDQKIKAQMGEREQFPGFGPDVFGQ